MAQRGFTLIEVLIVIFIISIVTSVAMLTISHNENRQLESFANELAQLMTLAEEQAMLQPSVLGLFLQNENYQFLAYQAGTDSKQQLWIPLADKLLGMRNIPSNIQVKIAANTNVGDDTSAVIPQIVISTNGDVTPFTIYVGKKGQKPRYAIRGDADGNITSQLLS